MLKAKAAYQLKIDAEGRRRVTGKRIRYPSTLSVNDEWSLLATVSLGSKHVNHSAL